MWKQQIPVTSPHPGVLPYCSLPAGFAPAPGQSQLTQDGTSWVLSLGDIAPGDTIDVPVTVTQSQVLNFPTATFQASAGSLTYNAAADNAAALTIQLVSTPDIPSGLTLSPASDSGVKGDDITDVSMPTITGAGDAGDAVTLYDGLIFIGIGLVGDDGTWSITTSILAPGTHALTATEVDSARNPSAASAVLTLVIDTIAADAGDHQHGRPDQPDGADDQRHDRCGRRRPDGVDLRRDDLARDGDAGRQRQLEHVGHACSRRRAQRSRRRRRTRRAMLERAARSPTRSTRSPRRWRSSARAA